MNLEPNVVAVKQANGVVKYRYNPASDAVNENVVKRKTFSTLEAANDYAKENNELIAVWRGEVKFLRNLSKDSAVGDLVKSYLRSIDYNKLTERTKDMYVECIGYWDESRLAGVPIDRAKLCNIKPPHCQRLYDEHAAHSMTMANHALAVYRAIFNYGIRNGYIETNPFSHVKTVRPQQRRVTWTREDVRAFMNTAFSRWEWRNVGLIVHMAYEWGQRLGDMRLLKWSNYDMEKGVLTLTQSKRRARVQLPTSKGLQDMLRQQHRDFGHQEYIAPSLRRVKRVLQPFSSNALQMTGRRIMNAAGISDELWLMDLRRTAISEMVENGVPVTSIMAISGHATPQSLTPYVRHTLKGATVAQEMRGFVDITLMEEA